MNRSRKRKRGSRRSLSKNPCRKRRSRCYRTKRSRRRLYRSVDPTSVTNPILLAINDVVWDPTQTQWPLDMGSQLSVHAEPNVHLGVCFLLYKRIDNPDIWEPFLKHNRVSCCVHSKYDAENYPCIRIPTMPTCWGCFCTVDAELTMMKHHLSNNDVSHVTVVTGSCIPLHSPDEVLVRLPANVSLIYWKGMPQGDILFPGCDLLCHSHYMVLTRRHATTAIRLIDPDDHEAQRFVDYVKETKKKHPKWTMGQPEEVLLGSWLILCHGVDEFINSMSTFFRFPRIGASSPIVWTPDTFPDVENIRKYCLFARKFDACDNMTSLFTSRHG